MFNKKGFAKNFVYTFTSNIVNFLLNAIILMMVPKVITTTDFGYFQYYLMIVSYTIYAHFGWIDGIYLRYSGDNYEDLNKEKFSGQFKYLVLFGILQSVVLSIILYFIPFDVNKKYAILIAILAILFVIPKTFAYVLMQVTSRFKEYSRIIITEKIFFGIILICMLIMGVHSFSILILSDLIAKGMSAIYGCYCCFDIIKAKTPPFRESITEFLENFKSGIFIMISNISTVLIAGIVQLVIENRWDIVTFGKVSLTFNISKTILVVIGAVGIIFFPMLKRVQHNLVNVIYTNIRTVLLTMLLILILGYYPLTILIEHWLPKYSESVKFMAILFPMCVFESKTSLLLNTYYKLLRKERALALINAIVVLLSLTLSIIAAYFLNSLYITVLVILFLLAIRSILLELYIVKCLKITVKKDLIIEITLVFTFVLLNSYTNNYIGGIVYFVLLLVYLLLYKKKIVYAINYIK